MTRTSREKPTTIADMLFYLPDALRRRELEQFRIEFESKHGPTDLTKRYTSTWPEEHQNWLLENHPKQWFDGVPEFAKAYLRQKMQWAAIAGQLDDMPDELVQLYVSKQMRLNREQSGR